MRTRFSLATNHTFFKLDSYCIAVATYMQYLNFKQVAID